MATPCLSRIIEHLWGTESNHYEQRALGDLVANLDFDSLHNSVERRQQGEFHLHGFHDDELLSLADA